MTASPEGSTSPAGSAHCYRHPNRETLIRCTRCERPICPDCMRPASVGFHCPDDVRRESRTVRAPRTAIGARLGATTPWVTGTLVALNVIVYLITGLQSPGTITDPTNSRLFIDWQLFPQTIHDQHRYYQLLTSAFLHLSPLHIAANMFALIVIGPPLEALLGRWRFLATYLLGALGGSAAIYAFGNAIGFTAGASGAIFALFGACLVLVRRLGLNVQWLVGIIVINFALTFAVPDISKLGHVGGFVTGVLAGVVIGGLPEWVGRRGARQRPRVPNSVQVAGLGGIGVLIVLVVALRTLTW